MEEQVPTPRFHALDRLRAMAMLLGLVLHSAISYTVIFVPGYWPYKAQVTLLEFDWLVFFIHLFRMPLFMLLAGFFTALLVQHYGIRGMLRNRFLRIFLPLATAWLVLFPLMKICFIYTLGGGSEGGTHSLALLSPMELFDDPSLMHLWFLYYLLFYYLAGTLMLALARRLPAGFQWRAEAWLNPQIEQPTGILFPVILTLFAHYALPYPLLWSDIRFMPDFLVVVNYGIFFFWGWLLFRRCEQVKEFSRYAWTHSALGIILATGYYLLLRTPLSLDPDLARLTASLIGSLAIWLLVYGLIGLSVRFLDHSSPVTRYLSDASYWMYLIHLPFTIWIPGLLVATNLSAVTQATLVLFATTSLTLLSYQLLVRRSWIGAWLNGQHPLASG